MAQNFKAGDRVFWENKSLCRRDSGEVVAVKDFNTGVYSIRPTYSKGIIWVRWDSDGLTQSIAEADLRLEERFDSKDLTEEAAVMFLLSKGYTVTEPKQ